MAKGDICEYKIHLTNRIPQIGEVIEGILTDNYNLTKKHKVLNYIDAEVVDNEIVLNIELEELD